MRREKFRANLAAVRSLVHQIGTNSILSKELAW